jgi:hypothetical protein
MKTRIIIILALITLNINLVSADNNTRKGIDGPVITEITISLSFLAPVTPAEATFEDALYRNPVVSFVSSLAPVTPKDASFEEIASGEETNIPVSAPVNQKVETIEKGKTVHPALPLPCDAKYGCSL